MVLCAGLQAEPWRLGSNMHISSRQSCLMHATSDNLSARARCAHRTLVVRCVAAFLLRHGLNPCTCDV